MEDSIRHAFETLIDEISELIIPEEDVEIGESLGKGASSEVFSGSFNYSPCAIKRIDLERISMNELVNIYRNF